MDSKNGDRPEGLIKAIPRAPAASPVEVAKAYELYLNSGMDLIDISIELGLPRFELARWAHEGKWRERKLQIEMELFNSAEDKYRNTIIQYRIPTLVRHLEVARMLEEQIQGYLATKLAAGESLTPSDIKRLSEALSSVTGVSSRAAGINDKSMENILTKNSSKEGRAPLVVINAGTGPLVPEMRAQAQEAQAEFVASKKIEPVVPKPETETPKVSDEENTTDHCPD